MDGLLPVIKPKGWTSFDVVRKLKRWIRNEKIGHAGNLDAAATGLLLIGIGSVTKQLSDWLHADKEYIFILQFGITTETLDLYGKQENFASVDPAWVNKEALEKLIQTAYLGEIWQCPPVYSALKLHGKRYSDLAREQIVIEPPKRAVKIYSFIVKEFCWDHMHPSAILQLHCSHGTYVRSLCRDIAKELHTVGLAKEICRTKIGEITLDDAVPLSAITDMKEIEQHLYRRGKA